LLQARRRALEATWPIAEAQPDAGQDLMEAQRPLAGRTGCPKLRFQAPDQLSAIVGKILVY
jgi:hypothetical protein